MIKLIFKALLALLCGFSAVFLLVFLPAGTISYPGGMMLIAVLFIPMLFGGIIMLIKSPILLERRLESREKQKGQGVIIALSGIMFMLGFISAGLDFRFEISDISATVQIVASVIFLIGYAMYFTVLYQNEYLSRTIKVTENQIVIDKGLYSVVRHPMYTATIIMFLSVSVILGSYISLLFFLFYPVLIIKRIGLEESFLEKELAGYAEYKNKVKYKLIPFIW